MTDTYHLQNSKPQTLQLELLLKLAGGSTLSATGKKVVAPPLHVTRTILWPTLWAATVDYVASVTPVRAKDWLRILTSAGHHFFTAVLGNTHRGQDFRNRVHTVVAVDLIQAISSNASRPCTYRLPAYRS